MPPSPATCRWAGLALAGVAVNLAALLLAPLVRPDVDPLRDSFSYYAVGPWSLLQTTAFAAIGIASLALGIALGAWWPQAPWMRVCSLFLAIGGMASLGLVTFPMGAPGPATVLGDLHQSAGTIAGVAHLAATLAFVIAARALPPWASLCAPAAVIFAVALFGAILSQLAIWFPAWGIPMGLTMRLLLVPIVVLWGLVALRCRRGCR